MRDALRVALVGYGLAGRVFHAPLIRATADLNLAAVVARSGGTRAAARSELPGVEVLDSVERLWDRAAEYDIAVIATPNRLHVDLATAALHAGLHVVVEKPFAATKADADRVIEAATATGRLLTVFHNRRWDGDFLTVAGIVADGAVGPVSRLESRFERWQPEAKLSAWRQDADPAEAGGLLYDLGSHLVDQAVQLFGAPTSVYWEMSQRRPGVAVDDDSFIALEHRDGVRSHLWASAVCAAPAARFRLLGGKGAFTSFGLDNQEAQLRSGMRPDDPAFGVLPENCLGQLVRATETVSRPTDRGRWADFYPRFAQAVRTGSPPPVDPHEAAAVIAILETIATAGASTGSASLRQSGVFAKGQ